MSLTPGRPGDAHVRRARAFTRQQLSRLLERCALQVEERASGLVITNRCRPEPGHVHVGYADFYVCWGRVTWEYCGRLEGFEPGVDEAEPMVGAAMILTALAPDDIHHLDGTDAGFHANHAHDAGTAQLSAPGSKGGPRPGYSQALQVLAEQLEGRGLAARLLTCPVAGAEGPRFDAVTARTPRARERGVIYECSDGLLTWEYSRNLDAVGAILDNVTNVLRAASPHFRMGRPR
jgi:hypothetical protein